MTLTEQFSTLRSQWKAAQRMRSMAERWEAEAVGEARKLGMSPQVIARETGIDISALDSDN